MLFRSPVPDGRSFAKDPCVVRFHGKAYLYYSTLCSADAEGAWQIGIAASDDLEHWERCGAVTACQPAEGKGICAPGAIVLGDRVHLFFQSYGQFPKDYICHAVSEDGIHFVHDPTNPIIRPTGDWNIGRAIDADVVVLGDRLLCYWATRDPAGKIQMLGVSGAPLTSDFSADAWTQLCDAPILRPELSWEQDCIEAPAAIVRNGLVYLFYAGAYNCSPQQISCATSADGVHFARVSDRPLLPPGQLGAWNASESGHPYAFVDDDGSTHLFYQGSPDSGTNWLLSRADVTFDGEVPKIVPTT